MSERKLKGYAVKLVRVDEPNPEERWVCNALGDWSRNKAMNFLFASPSDAWRTGIQAVLRLNSASCWKIQVIAVYVKTRRTAAEERADTIAFLRTVIGHGIADALKLLESGVHEGASKAPCMVVYSDADTDAAQLEALGRANG
jgi:hypothetical protein